MQAHGPRPGHLPRHGEVGQDVPVHEERLEEEEARFYRFARRSATECAAILDVCRGLKLVNEAQASAGREQLISVVAMLTTLVVRISGRESERAGAGAGVEE